jgi:hypothetical protein
VERTGVSRQRETDRRDCCRQSAYPEAETIGATKLLTEAISELDLPKGMISVLHGDRDLGRQLVADARVAKVSFTGSAGGVQRSLQLAPGGSLVARSNSEENRRQSFSMISI